MTKIEAPYTVVEPLFKRLKNNAIKQGYNGYLGILSYSLKYLNNF